MNALRSFERRIIGLLFPQQERTAIFRNVGNYLANDRPQHPEGLNHLHLLKQYVAVLCQRNLAVRIYASRNKFHAMHGFQSH